ncbi:hypothetical protein SRB17_83570 [Streptomyces sp. RB17]|uniref:hypothetical protein n=1 Tax=Streptomyces sp. RB17 TaxID=2585197 RepID=UPI00130C065E|nr:hypothetical protein [Streptomyces sp. RB17]MQY40324.1 hypothetical protein [Streptomyces sp. RB17]
MPQPHWCDAWVLTDYEAGLCPMLDHLAQSGARRIGLFLPLHDDAYPRLIAHAYRVLGATNTACPPSCRSTPISEDPDYATTNPLVTTLSLSPDRMGTEAVDLLIAVINARGGVDRCRLVQPVPTPRRSTRRPATDARRSGRPE